MISKIIKAILVSSTLALPIFAETDYEFLGVSDAISLTEISQIYDDLKNNSTEEMSLKHVLNACLRIEEVKKLEKTFRPSKELDFLKAILINDSKTIRFLVDDGASVQADVYLRSPLSLAASAGCVESARTLLDLGASINAATLHGVHALYLAAADDHLEMVKLLLDRGAEIDLTRNNIEGETALLIAVEKGNIDTVKTLLEHGAQINIHCNAPRLTSPLQIAAGTNNSAMVKLLLEHGADLTIQNSHGETALDIAKDYGYDAIVELLETAELSILR